MASSCGRRVIGRRHTKVVLNIECARSVRCKCDLRVSGEGEGISGTERSASIDLSMTALVDWVASELAFFSKSFSLVNLEHRGLPPAPVLRMGGGPRLEDTCGKNERREKERESMCVCMCVCVYVCMCRAR